MTGRTANRVGARPGPRPRTTAPLGLVSAKLSPSLFTPASHLRTSTIWQGLRLLLHQKAHLDTAFGLKIGRPFACYRARSIAARQDGWRFKLEEVMAPRADEQPEESMGGRAEGT